MSIGERIKYYRKEIGMSAEDLANIIGVSPSTIYRYENNDISNMGIDKLQAVASALHTNAYVLMGWDVSSTQSTQSSPTILSVIEQLNAEGQEKVLNYAKDLVSSGNYNSSSSDRLAIEKNADIEANKISEEFDNMRALSED